MSSSGVYKNFNRGRKLIMGNIKWVANPCITKIKTLIVIISLCLVTSINNGKDINKILGINFILIHRGVHVAKIDLCKTKSILALAYQDLVHPCQHQSTGTRRTRRCTDLSMLLSGWP